jgi:outer membrane protein assembly factor BamD (BamD/ComL family)
MSAYRTLLDRHARTPGAACLGRRQQLEVASALFGARDYPIAMAAYERFLDTYPKDPEAAHVKLLMGLIAARYLHQPDRARTLINDATPALKDQEQQILARELLADLRGGQPA